MIVIIKLFCLLCFWQS